MITDEKMVELVQRTQQIVMKGFARNMQFPEHTAIESPIMAAVLTELVRDAREQERERAQQLARNPFHPGVMVISAPTPEQAERDKEVGM